MGILLSHGYFLREDPLEQTINRPYPPLGILSISAYLKQLGKQVSVFDTTFSTRQDFENHVLSTRPPVVGLYVNMMTRTSILKMIKTCKRAQSMVILGGPEPVNYADQYLNAGADVIVNGEGETTLAELLDEKPRSEIGGIVYRDHSGRVVHNPSREHIVRLDDLPVPDRGAIDLDQYLEHWRRHHGYGSVSLITARGCPYTCRWCSHSVYGHSYRSRSPEVVADEVAGIHEAYAPEQLWYADDVFTMNKGWLRAYAAELDRRGLAIPFETITREDRLDEEVIGLLAAMKARKIWVGAESGSQKVLDAMDRKTDAARMREMIRLLRSNGIQTGTFVMFGYEQETWSDLDETARHLTQCLPDEVLTTVSYPIKGTPYYEDVEHKLIATSPWSEGSDRDLMVRGQKLRLFYRFTRDWIQGLMQLRRQWDAGRWKIWRLGKPAAKVLLARVGMYATAGFRTHG